MLLSRAVASPPLHSINFHSTFSHGSSIYFPATPCYSFSCVLSTAKGRRIERGTTVICMAKERRMNMVAKQMQRDLAVLIDRDQVVKRAVLPESAFGADLYLSSVATITDVVLSADLQIAKVYVSVFGDERGREVAMAGLKSKAKYIRTQLGKRMRFRLTPQLRFIEDVSIERGSRVIEILDQLKEERERDEERRKAKRGKDGNKISSSEKSKEEESDKESNGEDDEEEEADDDSDEDYDYDDELDELDDEDDDWIDDEFKEEGVFFIK